MILKCSTVPLSVAAQAKAKPKQIVAETQSTNNARDGSVRNQKRAQQKQSKRAASQSN